MVNGQPLTNLSAHILARCAAEATCYAVDWDPTRVHVREFPADIDWRQLDAVEKTRTEAQWLVRKERGTIM
jgi:hypothetical protein